MTMTGTNELLNKLAGVPNVIWNAIIEVFSEVGEYVVERIRNGEMSDWMNQSGNLRSSIGYVVCRRGNVVIMSDFSIVLDGSEGAKKGRELAERLARENASKDFVLIIVAGEEYAIYVEAIENKVVLSSAYLHIEKQMPRLLRDKIRNALDSYENRR